ncbi:MAG: hypothetical protein KJZ83_00710 [Burkholderiaceae bacterium]|nr:hypothetical protein [Burkholderiaceae bacterium]
MAPGTTVTARAGLVEALGVAARESGRARLAILGEWLALRLNRGRLGLTEYFDYRLHMRDAAFETKAAFGGWRAQHALEECLVDQYSRMLTLDKVTAQLLLQGLSVPMPELLAVYSHAPRPGPFERIRTAAEMSRFLASTARFPLYFKAAFGVKGKGNLSVVEGDASGVRTRSGERMSVEQLLARLEPRAGLGWMVQRELSAHREIAARCGERVSGVRVNVFLSNEGPRLLRATWKINVVGDSDNFDAGRSGNLVAAVDLANGTVTRVVTGLGSQQRELSAHPVSGAQLLGFVIPHWQELVRLVESTAGAFPGFICQGWDVALCDQGPVVLEVNDFGDLDLVQVAHGTGFLDARFMELLRGRDLERLFLGPRAPTWRSKKTGRLGKRAAHWPW